MKKGLVVFQSKYGATEKYARWLAETMDYDCLPRADARADLCAPYEILVYGGGIYASGIAGFSFIRHHAAHWKNKKIAVFCVGASPHDEKAFAELCSRYFKGELADIPRFYCRGAWKESAMRFTDRTLCKMLRKAVLGKSPEEYEPWERALISCPPGEDADWTDPAELAPLIAYLKKG